MSTKDRVLSAAVSEAVRVGYGNITRDGVGKVAGVCGPSVLYHFRSMLALKKAVMAYAVRCAILEIVAQGVVSRDPVAEAAPECMRVSALLIFSPQSAQR